MILLPKIWLRMMPRGGEIIYQYQKRSLARGHRDGAVRYFEGAHLSKKSPPDGGWCPSLLAHLPTGRLRTPRGRGQRRPSPPSALEAIKSSSAIVAVPGDPASGWNFLASLHRDRQVQRIQEENSSEVESSQQGFWLFLAPTNDAHSLAFRGLQKAC